MKKLTQNLISFAIVAIIFLGIGMLESTSHYYTRKNCEVVKVNGYCVTVEDNMGRWWDFEGEGFEVGDTVNVKMWDALTDSIKDDHIVDVKKA